jgi:hypothetical protein
MTLVEKVALALTGIEFQLPGAGGLRGRLHLAPAQAQELARAAIEAMREPTEEMKLKAAPFIGTALPAYAGEAWQAMIDAALNEEPDK